MADRISLEDDTLPTLSLRLVTMCQNLAHREPLAKYALIKSYIQNGVKSQKYFVSRKIILFLGFFKIHSSLYVDLFFTYQFFVISEKLGFCGLRSFVSSQSINLYQS